MSTQTSIEWTDVSWNPVRGCSLVSAGCANCYAMKQAHRFSGAGKPYEGLTELGPQGPRWTGKIQLVEEALDEPLHWKKPRRIFVNSMSDLFHEDVPDAFIERVWATMACADWHTFQILTKRPERMHRFLCIEDHWDQIGRHVVDLSPFAAKRGLQRKAKGQKIFGHVWLGVSVEDQKTADERIPKLLATPAAVRWVSAEPLLGPVDLGPYLAYHGRVLSHGGIDWVVVGGESGPGARPMHPEWAENLLDQCRDAGVPFFFKQWGEWKPISAMTEEETNALYASRIKAKPHEDQREIDESYGRRCTVETRVIRHDGEVFSNTDPGAWEMRNGQSAMQVFRFGKKGAGALLGGQEWREWPR